MCFMFSFFSPLFRRKCLRWVWKWTWDHSHSPLWLPSWWAKLSFSPFGFEKSVLHEINPDLSFVFLCLLWQMKSRGFGGLTGVWIENYWVLFFGEWWKFPKSCFTQVLGLLWALGCAGADPVGLSLQRVMTRSPSTLMTSSPTSKWSTMAGGEGCARAATASSLPTTWSSGSRDSCCCSCLNSPAHIPLHTLQTDHEAFPEDGGGICIWLLYLILCWCFLKCWCHRNR